LTPDRKRLREVGFSFVANSRCGAGAEVTPIVHVDFGNQRHALRAGRRIDEALVTVVDEAGHPRLSFLFRGVIRGDAASGVVSDEHRCYPRFAWTAHRVEASMATTGGRCVARGARWSLFGRTGTRYEIILTGAGGVSCAFAQRWVARLSGRKPVGSGTDLEIPGGPPGWSCVATWTSPPFPSPRAWAGGCIKAGKGTFGWNVPGFSAGSP
jgi:hypothetical protein